MEGRTKQKNISNQEKIDWMIIVEFARSSDKTTDEIIKAILSTGYKLIREKR